MRLRTIDSFLLTGPLMAGDNLLTASKTAALVNVVRQLKRAVWFGHDPNCLQRKVFKSPAILEFRRKLLPPKFPTINGRYMQTLQRREAELIGYQTMQCP